MKLFKILGIIFLVYFIRRFIQMYRVMKALQENQNLNAQSGPQQRPDMQKTQDEKNVVDADFKVID